MLLKLVNMVTTAIIRRTTTKLQYLPLGIERMTNRLRQRLGGYSEALMPAQRSSSIYWS
mgnify:CR=1 FL=1|jgi:hypothetical protein